MRIFLTASLFLTLGLIPPVSLSVLGLSEDLEGSGFDLDSSGFGSGDVSEQASPGESKNVKDQASNKELSVNTEGGTRNTLHGSSVETFDNSILRAKDGESEIIFEGNTNSFLENKEILCGVIAGGVTGAISAATLAGILIYKWQHHKDGGYVLGRPRA